MSEIGQVATAVDYPAFAQQEMPSDKIEWHRRLKSFQPAFAEPGQVQLDAVVNSRRLFVEVYEDYH